MAASNVVAAAPLLPAAAGKQATSYGTGTRAAFDASVWGDFFVNYVPPPTQRSEEWMRARAEQHKGQVRQMFEAAKAKGSARTVTLVDALERLGIDNHFCREIDAALCHVQSEVLEHGISSDDLHIVALCFRLLRQHGLWVPADVFDKFRDGTGKFRENLRNDARGLLSLYNAAHMAVPGEEEAALDDAIAFARRHLEAAKGRLASPMAEQAARALGIPLPRFMQRLEAMHYIAEYEQEAEHDAKVLELARLEFALAKSLYLKELKDLTLWWRDLYSTVKLPYTRDRIVEMYFWALGVFHTEEYSRARIVLTKIIAVTSLMDDTYDVRATLEEAQKFNEAIQRWDESAVSTLPEYLRTLYIKTLSTFGGFEDILEPDEKYRVPCFIKSYQLVSQCYLQEAKWYGADHVPTFDEHIALSAVSSTLPMLSMAALLGSGRRIATRKVLAWGIRVPGVFRACGEVGRLLNDIAAYKEEKNKRDVATSVESYQKEHGCAGEEAVAAARAASERAWRRMNWACVEMDPALLPAARQVVLNFARVSEVVYFQGRDAYTVGGDLRDLVTSLFLEPAAA